MPLRAIPFEVVCLLGMNDGDYPRRGTRSDFDLMAQPGQQRPGDRARRDDDRQLMLEALLSARRLLYLSWSGRSVRDNGEQPPSVLVSQLRDYLAAGWSQQTVDERTTEHPLQPFSRRYFERGAPLFTHAREWRAAHAPDAAAATGAAVREAGAAASATVPDTGAARVPAPFEPGAAVPLTVARLAAFLRNPVKAFFRDRLGVHFDETLEAVPDTEAFGFDKLEEYGLVDELTEAVVAALSGSTFGDSVREAGHSVRDAGHSAGDAGDAGGAGAPPAHDDLVRAIDLQLRGLERAGRLPIGGMAAHARAHFATLLLPMLGSWRQALADHPREVPRRALRFEHPASPMEDWLDRRVAGPDEADAPRWLELSPGRLLEGRDKQGQDGDKPRKDAKKPAVRADKLVRPWVLCLLAAASEAPTGGLLVARDCVLEIRPLEAEPARATLAMLLDSWREGMAAPLPVAIRTALDFVTGKDPVPTYEGREAENAIPGEGTESCLARCYPDFESLSADGRFETLAGELYAPLALWAAQHVTMRPHAGPAGATQGSAA
jgi:exodeoxyribonuclease V gamma subunit